ncbi:MAG: MBL fold metallo-hydrolase [Chloroflexia bacterium]|nr:MBL fold metallo-hydrolase [Chloroflexia bacterium]
MKKLYAILVLISLSIGSCSQNSNGEHLDKLIKINRVSERVIVVGLASDAVTAINTRDGIVVIDAGISSTLTAKYRKLIENEFDTKNFVYLINTHSHHDHTNGNVVFDDATIIGHKNCRLDFKNRMQEISKLKVSMLKAVESYKKQLTNLIPKTEEWNWAYSQKMRYQFAFGDLSASNYKTAIDSTFNDTMHLVVGDLSFDLIYFGDAHSSSDIIIHVPELKLLMTGDLFSSFGRPSIDKDKIEERCKDVVKELKNRLIHIETMISGHGQLLTTEDLKMFIEKIENWGGI